MGIDAKGGREGTMLRNQTLAAVGNGIDVNLSSSTSPILLYPYMHPPGQSSGVETATHSDAHNYDPEQSCLS